MYPFDRRQFLVQSSALAMTGTLGGKALQASPNDRLKVAFIGVGGRGARNLKTIVATGKVEVTAICDVDSRFLESTNKMFPQARPFRDFRRLYDAMGAQIDAAVVSTTEHTHAYATMPALQLGKHVYCEKPLAYNIAETRAVTEAAARAGVVTQMGTQIHASENYHRVVELIQSGSIGAVREAHVWVGRAWGLQSKKDAEKNDRLFVDNRPAGGSQPPDYLDWNLWIGPAPMRPFHEVYFPGPNWYRWWDFGNGTMSDLGSHWNDLPYWALKLDAPKTVQAFGPPPHPEIAPASMSAEYHYAARGDLPAVKLVWHQGTSKPEIWERGEIPNWPSGVVFIGEKGMLVSDYRKHVLLPESEFKGFEYPQPFIPDSPGHHEEWVAACFGDGATGSPFSYAGPLTEANHLGNVAYRVGKKITWDPIGMRCIDCPEADPFIRRKPRDGWSLS